MSGNTNIMHVIDINPEYVQYSAVARQWFIGILLVNWDGSPNLLSYVKSQCSP